MWFHAPQTASSKINVSSVPRSVRFATRWHVSCPSIARCARARCGGDLLGHGGDDRAGGALRAGVQLSCAFRGRAELLDEPETIAAIDDLLDVRQHVPLGWCDEKAVRVRANLLVLGERHLDDLDALDVHALAGPVAVGREGLERLVQLLDPVVRGAEQRLVLGGAPLTGYAVVHEDPPGSVIAAGCCLSMVLPSICPREMGTRKEGRQ